VDGDIQGGRVLAAPGSGDRLARLDEARAAEVDPRWWTDNLAALREQDPRLAARLEQTPSPEHWRAVEALDASLTFRIEPPERSPQWLAATAVPATRAAALLADFHPGDGNHALPSIATGAELILLLERLPPQKAVFVFETELATLAAVLRIVKLAGQVKAGRCILVPPETEEAWLSDLLDAHPGLLPPGNILRLPGVSPRRLEHLRGVCERVALRTTEQRARRIEQLTRAATSGRSTTNGPTRLAVLALNAEPAALVAGRQLAHAAAKLGWDARLCATNGPRAVHGLTHIEALARQKPSLTICVNHSRSQVPYPLPVPVCEWYLSSDDVPKQLADDGVWRLAATPTVAKALEAAVGSVQRVLDFFWACQETTGENGTEAPAEDAVVLVADLFDTRPEVLGIDQTTHMRLWEHLHTVATRAWETPDIRSPRTLLRTAERSSGVRLGESALRSRMLQLTERVLIPTVIGGRILRALEQEHVRVLTAGRGWKQDAAAEMQPLAEDGLELDAAASRIRPAAAIFVGRPDPLTPALLSAGAHGWPLLLHSPGGRPLSAQLGNVLRPDQHFQAFGGAGDLRAALRTSRNQTAQAIRRGDRTRRHLLENHSYAQRLKTLAQRVGIQALHDDRRP
jgi:hypothetical protein